MDQITPLLQDLKVLICRPEPSSSELARVFETMGAQTECLPCIEIQPIELDATQRQLVLDLDQYDSVIVTSQHAARSIGEYVDEYWPQAPVNQKWFGMGAQSTSILKRLDLDVDHNEETSTSERFLERHLSLFAGQKVLICAGEGGRDLLREALTEEAQKVDELNLYRRVRPAYASSKLESAIRDFEPAIVVALSSETVESFAHFAAQVGVKAGNLRLVVSSERVATKARKLGFPSPYVADNLRPIDLIQAVRKAALNR